jgi:cyanophycinase
MAGVVALVGSGEYLDVMDDIDRRLLAESGRPQPRVVCLPTAAGLEGMESVDQWSRMGVEHFRKLGAHVEALPIIDRASADDPKWAKLIESADLIYFSGGDPLYLCRTLIDTRTWAAVENAWARGAVFAGCSAGAMILGVGVPDVQSPDLAVYPAFNRIANAFILPHFDRLEDFRPGVTELIRSWLADGQYALGIDENTALIGHIGGEWEVMGAAGASLLTRRSTARYAAGNRLTLL